MIEMFDGRPSEVEGRESTEIAVYDFLDRLGIEYRTACHEAAFTMEECSRVERELGAGICKNLFLTNRQQTDFYLLMIPADKVFKTKYLSSQLGCARLSFAGEEHMVRLLGIRPGAVSPMGLMNDAGRKVRFIIDRDLMGEEYVGCHPCVNTSTLRLRLADILDRFAPATGHDVTVVDLLPE